MPHRTPYTRSSRFALLLVLLVLGVAATAAFMSTRSAERSMLVGVERQLSIQARDDIAELMVWYAGLRGQLDRVATSDVFRLYAAESLRLGEHTAATARTATSREAAELAAHEPFMRKLLQDFVTYTEFESARLMHTGQRERLVAGDHLTPLSADQQRAVAEVLATGNFAQSTVRDTPQGLVLDLLQPVFSPDAAAGANPQHPVAVLMATRNITDRLTRVEQNARSTEGGRAWLALRRDGVMRAMRPEGLAPEPVDWPLEDGRLPMALRPAPASGAASYVIGLPVPGLPWLLIEAQEQGPAEAAFQRKRQSLFMVAAVAAMVAIGLLGLIWWFVVGRRDRAFSHELGALRETVNHQNQLLQSLDAAKPAGVVLCDEAGRLIRVNPLFAALLGHSVESLPGLALGPLLPDEVATPLCAALEKVRATGEPAGCTVTADLPGLTEQAGLPARRFTFRCSPFYNLAGQCTGTLCVMHSESIYGDAAASTTM